MLMQSKHSIMRAGATSPAVRSGAFLRQSCATQQRRQLHVRAAGGEQDGQPGEPELRRPSHGAMQDACKRQYARAGVRMLLQQALSPYPAANLAPRATSGGPWPAVVGPCARVLRLHQRRRMEEAGFKGARRSLSTTEHGNFPPHSPTCNLLTTQHRGGPPRPPGV
jgi:hypothetical protein